MVREGLLTIGTGEIQLQLEEEKSPQSLPFLRLTRAHLCRQTRTWHCLLYLKEHVVPQTPKRNYRI